MTAKESPANDFIDRLGGPLGELWRTLGEIFVLLGRTIRTAAEESSDRREVVRQLYDMGVRSLLFIAVTLGVLGMISLYQGCTQVERILPDFSRAGATYLATLVREFGPVICGLMVATRTGSAIAAQVGSMVVTEQVDALRMCNTDPVRYLVVPRFLAGGPMLLVLTIFGVFISFFAGMLTARIGWEVPYSTYINLSMVHLDDVVMGVLKSLSFGYAIPIIAAHAGLSAHGGSEGVGAATTRSVVNCSFAVIVLDFMISSGSYLLVN